MWVLNHRAARVRMRLWVPFWDVGGIGMERRFMGHWILEACGANERC